MGLLEFKKGAVICKQGDSMQEILFITNGTVEAMFEGRIFIYEKGDMLGICDLTLGIYSCSCKAVTDVTIFTYPYRNLSALEKLLNEKGEIAGLLVNSMCRQILNLLQYKINLKSESETAYESVNNIYEQYEKMCGVYAFASKKLDKVSEAVPFAELDLIDEWVYTYYMGIKELDAAVRNGFFNKSTGITLGFIRKSADDALQAINSCKDYIKYMKDISQIFLNAQKHDLFNLISELHFNSVSIKGADEAVGKLMSRLTGLLSGMTGINPSAYNSSIADYENALANQRNSSTVTEEVQVSGAKRNLADSLNVILEYSTWPQDKCSKFMRSVQDYANVTDRGSTDDAVNRLRRELTASFYDLHQLVFVKSLMDASPPTIIKMFLNFGYVDAALAGFENADYLYSVAESLKGDPKLGVYTIYEWLTAIYKGKKDPCRNELGEDYADTIRMMKAMHEIDEKDEVRLLSDNAKKLRFELENVFPVTNKITYGVISTFCPLFSERNVQRKLETSLITPELIMKSLDEIRAVDFSAFYREATYTNPEIGINTETVHTEVLPNFILTPTVGTRGIMWQEIEGKKRNTPARMFMPLFFQSDLKALFIKLSGEFRWEMCKRVQGARWNDISDKSLTSEYCDYLQFYKSNRDLSSEIKESVKIELAHARNNFKAVFISNYSDWIVYEANGSSRLNKSARRLLLTYCPFLLPIREKLSANPQYADLISKFNIKTQQRVQQLSRVTQKITQSGHKIPKELQQEMEYANK
jgi:CRP-like cAMP-binding protein